MKEWKLSTGISLTIPVLVGLITAAAAIYALSLQLQQQNELERKRVEASYLTKALDKINSPADLLMKLAQDEHEFKNRLKIAPNDKLPNYEAGRAFGVEFQQGIKSYSDAMLTATYFSELIEDGSVLRKGGRNELFDALMASQDAGVALLQITPDAQSEKIPIAQLSTHPLYQKSEAASHVAAKAIIRRLQEIYGSK
jgi:uncharacterized membrane-anchored protein YhcB (DUF1043 family)